MRIAWLLGLLPLLACASPPAAVESRRPCPAYLELSPTPIQKCECKLHEEPMCVCWEEPLI